MAAPLNVAKDVSKDQPKNSVWRWSCRVPLCGADDWASRHPEAVADARAHLRRHAMFGIR